MSARTRKIVLGVLLVALCLAAFLARVERGMIDFEVDYEAGRRLTQGEQLYQGADGHYIYKYLPAAAMLEAPFSLLPLRAAKLAFYAFAVFCLVTVFRVSYDLLPAGVDKSPRVIVLTFLVLAKFVLREIELGQINIVITALLLLMLRRLISDDERRSARDGTVAGLLWAVATVLKPYALVFVPYFVLTRRWRTLLTGLATLAVALVAPTLFYGWQGNIDIHRAWASTLSGSTPHLLTNLSNSSLLGLFMKWTSDEALSTALLGFAVACLAVLMLLVVRRGEDLTRPEVLDGALLLTLIPLLAPLGWDYMLLMSVLGVMLLIQHAPLLGRTWHVVLAVNLWSVGLTLSPLIGRALYSEYKAWSVVTVNFLVVVGFLAALRFRRFA